MTLAQLIDDATARTGTQKATALALGVKPQQLTDAKHGRIGLPDYACFRLAALLDLDPAQVIAASALVTEKDPERRAVFAPFALGKTATWLIAIVTSATTATIAPTGTAHANQLLNGHNAAGMCIMSNYRTMPHLQAHGVWIHPPRIPQRPTLHRLALASPARAPH